MVSTEAGHNAHEKGFNKYAGACAIVASVISIISGYDTGVMSGALVFIKDELKISETQVEVLAGILNICALFGSLAAGKFSDLIGRRYTIQSAAILFLLGAVFMGYGPSFAILMLGRCTAGIGVGFALMTAPVYSAEISRPTSRGILTSLPELGLSLGVLLGYVSNYFLGKLTLKLGWRIMLGIAAIPSLALAIAIFWMPESPRWLVLQGKIEAGRKVLLKVSNTKEEAEQRLRDIKIAAGIDHELSYETNTAQKNSKINNNKGAWKELLIKPTPAVRWILLAAIGLHFFEHATGIEAVILYSPRIFKKSGIATKNKTLLATVGVGITKLVCVIGSTFMLDNVGRRRLLLISTTGMIVALVSLGFGLTMVEHSNKQLSWALTLCIIAVYTFVAFVSIGLAPVTWVYGAEIFPLKLRALGVGIGVAVNRLMNALISMSFISIYKTITIGGTFFMFAGISVLALLFFYFFLPETKNRSLEEMEMIFTKDSSRHVDGVQ